MPFDPTEPHGLGSSGEVDAIKGTERDVVPGAGTEPVTLRQVGVNPDPVRSPFPLHLSISPRRTLWHLSLVVFLLIVASVVSQTLYLINRGRVRASVDLSSLDREESVPTWFQAALLLLCFALLLGIALWKRRGRAPHVWGWIGLALTFLFLSVDEVASLHEKLSTPLRSALHADGVLRFTWVVGGGTFCLLFLLCYLRFLRDLDRRSRLLFLAAGLVYVAGALGMEMVGSAYASVHTTVNPVYAMLIVTIEEALEMLGLVLFVYTLLSYIGAQWMSFGFHVRSASPASAKVNSARRSDGSKPRRAPPTERRRRTPTGAPG